MSKVETRMMTESERLAYIEKHPIRRTKKERNVTFTTDYPDWKWRHEKAVKASLARWGK